MICTSVNRSSAKTKHSLCGLVIRGFFSMFKNRFAAVFLSIICIAVLSAPIYGHHGTGIAYDNTKPTVVKGTVTDFEWRNPHAQLFLDVKDTDGKILKWAVEMN